MTLLSRELRHAETYPTRAVQVHRRVLELGARVQTLHAMHERTDEKLAAMDEKLDDIPRLVRQMYASSARLLCACSGLRTPPSGGRSNFRQSSCRSLGG